MATLVKPGTINKTVTTAGTRVQLNATELIVRNAMVQAINGNTGLIYLGISNVSNAVYGAELNPGTSISLELPEMGVGGANDFDISSFWVDAENDGNKVCITYFKRD